MKQLHYIWFAQLFLYKCSFFSRFLASLLVEVGEYDISGPNEMMSTKEMKVKVSMGMINDVHKVGAF